MTDWETFVYRLTLANRSLYELTCTGGELRRGRWFRGGEKDARPASVSPGETVEAMAIMGAPGKGYACLCAWNLIGSAGAAGAISLRIDVPFLSGKNKAGLDVSGAVRVEGWTGIPTVGNVFSHELTIRPA